MLLIVIQLGMVLKIAILVIVILCFCGQEGIAREGKIPKNCQLRGIKLQIGANIMEDKKRLYDFLCHTEVITISNTIICQ